jgi:hypothetical protein
MTYKRHETLPLHGQNMSREPDEAETKAWDVNVFTRAIDQRMTALTQQLRHDPTSKIEELLGLSSVQTGELWRLGLESVQSLKSK